MKAAPFDVFSQFKVEIVTIDSDHVGFINSAGYYLSAISDQVDWFVKTPASEERFSPEIHGEWQAFKSYDGQYLNINDDGFLDIISTDTVKDSQLFAVQGFSGEFEQDRLIATLPKWGPEFYITFDLLIRSMDKADWCNAFVFTTNGNSGGHWGERLPGIWTHKHGYIGIFSQIGANPNAQKNIQISLETWYKVEVEQRKNSKGEVKFLKQFS